MTRFRSQRPGITLLELIIVIGVLLLLAALLLPAVARVRIAAGRTQSINNLKQICLAVHNFHDVNKGMPPITGKYNNVEGSVLYHLLPYLEQDNVFRQAKGNSWTLAQTVIPLLVDPEDKSAPNSLHLSAVATTSYAGNWLIMNGKYKIFNIPDGSSNTLLFTTRYQICNGTPTAWAYSTISPWSPMFAYYSLAKFQVNPTQEECDPYVTQAIGRVMVAGLADGSVRSVDAGVSPRTWYHATVPDDGVPFDVDW